MIEKDVSFADNAGVLTPPVSIDKDILGTNRTSGDIDLGAYQATVFPTE